MIKIFKTLLNIVLGLIVWFFIMVLFLSPHIISKIENDFLSNVLMLAWFACLIGFIWLIARDYTPKKAYSVKNGVNEVDEIKNKFNALCQEFHKNKREYDELEKIINSNLYIIQNNCQQKYLEYKNIKNETFILFDKLKVLNSDQIYTNKDRFLEFEQMCNGINELKNISIILKDFISKKQTTPEPTYTPQPRLSKSERLLKEYEEKQYLKAEEIGRRYERYIGYLYEIDGYKVDYNGIKKGVKDGGVDLICSKRKELIIIQCKCRDDQGQIHENTILQLIANLMKYKRKYPNKNVSAVIYTSHDNLDDEAKATLADEVAHGALIHHIIKAYDNSYPKVKCNISDNGEKIYHIPDHSSTYDRIQIEINKGEFFAKTIKEAESAGFRASKA